MGRSYYITSEGETVYFDRDDTPDAYFPNMGVFYTGHEEARRKNNYNVKLELYKIKELYLRSVHDIPLDRSKNLFKVILIDISVDPAHWGYAVTSKKHCLQQMAIPADEICKISCHYFTRIVNFDELVESNTNINMLRNPLTYG